MKNPRSPKPNLAQELFASSLKGDPSTLNVFADSIREQRNTRNRVWAVCAVLTYVVGILIPALALFSGYLPRLGWLLIPGVLFALGFAATAPTGEK